MDAATIAGIVAASIAGAGLLISLGTLIYNYFQKRTREKLARAMEENELKRLQIVTVKPVTGHDVVKIVVQNRSTLPVQINHPQFVFRCASSKQQVGTFFEQPRLKYNDTFDYYAEFPGIDADTILSGKDEILLTDIG